MLAPRTTPAPRAGAAVAACVAALAAATMATSSCGALLGIEDLSGPTQTTSGTGGGVACEPSAKCYTGPAGTENVGVCVGGTCNAAGDQCSDTIPYIEDCSTSDDENCDGEGQCTGEGAWSVAGGGVGSQDEIVVAADVVGNVYVAGGFKGSFAFDGGPTLVAPLGTGAEHDVFLAKLDTKGKHVFSKSFGGDTADQIVGGIAATSEGAVIVGTANGSVSFGGAKLAAGANSIFVAAFDAAGGHLFSSIFDGSADERGADVAIDSNADIYILGEYNGDLTLPSPAGAMPNAAGGVSTVVVKLSSSGVILWATAFGSPTTTHPRKIDAAPDGTVVIAGEFTGAFDVAGIPVEHSAGGDADVFVVRLAGSSGAPVGAGSFGSPSEDAVGGLAVDGAGGIFVAATHADVVTLGGAAITGTPANGLDDVLLVKLEPSGTGLSSPWNGEIAGPDRETAHGVAVDPSGNVVVVGSYRGQVNASWSDAGQSDDLYLVKWLANGDESWFWDIGGPGVEVALDVAIDPLGNIYAGGTFDGDMVELVPHLDAANTEAAPGDLFVIKRVP